MLRVEPELPEHVVVVHADAAVCVGPEAGRGRTEHLSVAAGAIEGFELIDDSAVGVAPALGALGDGAQHGASPNPSPSRAVPAAVYSSYRQALR